MIYKLVIFDFDGTLADSIPWFLRTVNSMADTFRFKRVEESEIDTLRGYSARQVVQHMGVPLWKMPMIARRVRSLSAQDIDQISLFEGVDQVLQRLSQNGVTLAIATSNTYDNVRRVLGPRNTALVRYYECGASIFGKAPRFRRILKDSGFMPGETLCIGDEIRDSDAAKQEGIPFGAVGWGATKLEALQTHNPAEVFTHVGEIGEKLLA